MYINERTNCSWQKHAIPKRTASGTLIHCEATNPVPQHRQGPVELEQVRRTKRRVAKDLFRIHQVTTKVAGFQHISMANQLFSICFNGISLKIELLRLLVHRTFYSLVFWYTNNLQYEILISHGKKHLWFWDIMGERLEYSIPIPLFLEIPNPPKTQRVFWVNPSFSYSTLRKTNICILYCNYNQQQFYEYVNRLVVSICLNHFQQPWIFWWNHWHLRNLVPSPIFSEKSGSSTICPWDSSPIFFRSFSVFFFSEEPDLFHHSSIGFCWGKPGIFHHSSDFLGAKPVFSPFFHGFPGQKRPFHGCFIGKTRVQLIQPPSHRPMASRRLVSNFFFQ